MQLSDLALGGEANADTKRLYLLTTLETLQAVLFSKNATLLTQILESLEPLINQFKPHLADLSTELFEFFGEEDDALIDVILALFKLYELERKYD